MLVRKFLRPKLTDEAKIIVERLEDFERDTFSEREINIIKQSLYKTEMIWEMEP